MEYDIKKDGKFDKENDLDIKISTVNINQELKNLESKLQYDFGKELSRLDDEISNQNKYIEKIKNDLKNLSITLYAEAAMIVGILIYVLCN